MIEAFGWFMVALLQIFCFVAVFGGMGWALWEVVKLVTPKKAKQKVIQKATPKPDYDVIYKIERDLGMPATTDKGKQEAGYIDALMDDIASLKNQVRKAEIEAGHTTMSSYFDRNGIHVDDLSRMGFTDEQIVQMIIDQEG